MNRPICPGCGKTREKTIFCVGDSAARVRAEGKGQRASTPAATRRRLRIRRILPEKRAPFARDGHQRRCARPRECGEVLHPLTATCCMKGAHNVLGGERPAECSRGKSLQGAGMEETCRVRAGRPRTL